MGSMFEEGVVLPSTKNIKDDQNEFSEPKVYEVFDASADLSSKHVYEDTANTHPTTIDNKIVDMNNEKKTDKNNENEENCNKERSSVYSNVYSNAYYNKETFNISSNKDKLNVHTNGNKEQNAKKGNMKYVENDESFEECTDESEDYDSESETEYTDSDYCDTDTYDPDEEPDDCINHRENREYKEYMDKHMTEEMSEKYLNNNGKYGATHSNNPKHPKKYNNNNNSDENSEYKMYEKNRRKQYGEQNDENNKSNYPNNVNNNENNHLGRPQGPTPIDKEILYNGNGKKEDAEKLKEDANSIYKTMQYQEAILLYTKAIKTCPLTEKPLRAIIYANRAACNSQMKNYQGAISDCTHAVRYDPTYAKAFLRRSKANETIGKWHDALSDINKAMEIDEKIRTENYYNQKRIERESKIHFEKEKDEMMGKMKDLGNMLLGKVGLSTDNFKFEQNESGSYNIQFQQ